MKIYLKLYILYLQEMTIIVVKITYFDNIKNGQVKI